MSLESRLYWAGPDKKELPVEVKYFPESRELKAFVEVRIGEYPESLCILLRPEQAIDFANELLSATITEMHGKPHVLNDTPPTENQVDSLGYGK